MVTATLANTAPSSVATAAPASADTSAITTFAPSETNLVAMPLPKPDAAPETMATLPSNLPGIVCAAQVAWFNGLVVVLDGCRSGTSEMTACQALIRCAV